MTKTWAEKIKELKNNNNSYKYVSRDSYVDFLTAMLNCRISGMDAENQQREIQGESMAYVADHYYEVYEKFYEMYESYVKQLEKNKRG